MIEVGDGEELRGMEAEGVLCECGDGLGVFAVSGDVGEEEEEMRVDDDGVEEVAAGANGVVADEEIEARERRQSGRQWGSGGLG